MRPGSGAVWRWGLAAAAACVLLLPAAAPMTREWLWGLPGIPALVLN